MGAEPLEKGIECVASEKGREHNHDQRCELLFEFHPCLSCLGRRLCKPEAQIIGSFGSWFRRRHQESRERVAKPAKNVTA